MDISSLWALQIMMFLLMVAGAVLKRRGVIDAKGRTLITDLVVDFILPCNIINSFRMTFNLEILKRMIMILVVSILVQAVSYVLCHTIYNNKPDGKKRVLQYCTIVSNSGFLGLPVIEGIFGTEALMYASIFLIPLRIMMWSAGISCFTEGADMRSVVKKLATHPCIVAVYIGLPLLLFGGPLGAGYRAVTEAGIPVVSVVVKMLGTALDKAVRAAGGCTTTMTMLLIGTMLADVKASELFAPDGFYITAIRQGLLPLAALLMCLLLHANGLITGIAVIMTGMPVGSTSAILAAKYNCDYLFATKCVVVSTVCSLLTIPVWYMLLNAFLVF